MSHRPTCALCFRAVLSVFCVHLSRSWLPYLPPSSRLRRWQFQALFAVSALLSPLFVLPAVAALDAVPQSRLDATLRCALGVYEFSANRHVTITGSNGQERRMGYTLSDGRFGELSETSPGIFAYAALQLQIQNCTAPTLTMRDGNMVERGRRVRLIERVSTFNSQGVALYGKLIRSTEVPPRALAVWVEGSNNNASTDDSVWQYELAIRGVAVFVYEKRGTGRSAGVLTSDVQVRASDTAAAVLEAKRLAPTIQRVGVIGASQGGWVVPLVPALVPLDFVVAAFAMAEGPVAQDRALVEMQLAAAGVDDAARAEAKQLLSITERIVRSGMGDGLDELDAFKARYGNSAWLKKIQPRSYTGLFLQFSSADIKTHGPALAQGLRFDFEPRPLIETIAPRQLWLLAGRDRQAPSAGTQAILREVQQTRRDVDVVVFGEADHGLIEPVPSALGGGNAYAAGVFDITADWVKASVLPLAGRTVHRPGHGRLGRTSR
jgi:uncharacterized protein